MSEKSKNHRSTVEIYRDLMHIEVRSLVQRVAELTGTVGEMFSEINAIAIQLEEYEQKMHRISAGIDYCREELGSIRQTIGAHESALNKVENKVASLKSKNQST